MSGNPLTQFLRTHNPTKTVDVFNNTDIEIGSGLTLVDLGEGYSRLEGNGSGYVPTSRTITINGVTYDLSANRSWSVAPMVYPGAGIALSTGSAWDTPITNNSGNWNTAYGWGNHASAGYELASNKATTFGTINDTLYPTVKAVNDAINTAVIGLLDYRGSYDASTNLYPATGGSGVLGAVLKGDFWICSVGGTLGGTVVYTGDLIIALVDTPAQTASNWNIVEYGIGFVPENSSNKVTSISGSSTDTQYPSAKLLYDQLAGKISTYASQTAKYFLAAPNAGDGTPSFRAIVASDIPSLSYQAPLNGTGLVRMAGTAVSYDNSSYLTSVGTGVANEITYWSGTNTLGSLATATYPTLTELSYVKGVTSGIQSQLNGKQATLTNPITGTGTTNEISYWASASTQGTLAVATYPSLTELSYVKGVTSGIQSQINGKQATITNPVTGTGTLNQIAYWSGTSAIGTLDTATYPSLTELSYVKGVTSAIQTQIGTKAPTVSPTFTTDATTPIIKLSATSNQAVFQSAGVTGTLTWTPATTNKTITLPNRTLTVDNITTATTSDGTGFLKANGTVISFDNSTYLTSVTAHNLLSATHGDTTASAVARGSIIIGDATPKWVNLAFPATPTGKVLIATATDITWSTSALGTAAYTASTSYLASGGTAADSSKLGGALPAAYALVGQTMYIGTTGVVINRASANLALTGITSIDGSSASCTGNSATASKSTNLIGGNNTTLLGSIPYQSNTDVTTLLAPNTTVTKNFLTQTGNGTNGAAPTWGTVAKADVGLSAVENTALSTWAGTANITTLGTVVTGVWHGTAIDHAYLSGIAQADVAGLTTADTPQFAGLTITNTGNIKPSANSNNAIRIAQADGTAWMYFDTTNKKVGVGAVPSYDFHVKKAASCTFGVESTNNGSSAGFYVNVTNGTAPAVPQSWYFVCNYDVVGGFEIYDATGSASRLIILPTTGFVGINTYDPKVQLDVASDTMRLRTAKTPASATAAGAIGTICWDVNYIYICTATNTWKRSAIATW